MKDTIMTYCKHHDWVTFAELNQHLERLGFKTQGRLMITTPVDYNMILWTHMSRDYAKAIQRLRYKGKIHLHPVPVVPFYAVDQMVPDLPIVTDVKEGGFKTEHWLPVCLRTVP